MLSRSDTLPERDRQTDRQTNGQAELLSRCSQQRDRLHATGQRACPSVRLSVCLFVCLSVTKLQKNAIFSKTKQFTAMV